jgi:hypothetical protein
MQTGSSDTLIGWKSGKTAYVPLWDRMNGRSVAMDFGDLAERDKFKPVLPRLSLAENLEKPLVSLYGTEWRERGYGLCCS